jgi:oligopeptide transport system permease protein
MRWYIGRRLLQVIPVFLGATLLLYALVFLRPGDPVNALGGERGLPEAVQEQIRAEFHLDEPFIVQYLLYLQGILTLDLGTTFSGRPVSEEIAQAFPVNLQLALMALAFEAIFGITAGLVAGLRKGKIFDSSVLLASLVVIAIPIFVLGFVLQLVFGVYLGWAKPTVGTDVGWDTLLLPAFALALVSFAYVLRLTRASVIENSTADYVRTATAKGLSRPRVVMAHILRNSMIPVVTYLGASLGGLMGGAIVTEGIFNVPGVGQKLYQAILRSEGPTVVAIVSVLVLVFVVANLLVDLLYAWLDPRIRYEK